MRGLPGSEADFGVDAPDVFATAEHHPGQPPSMSYVVRMTGKSHRLTFSGLRSSLSSRPRFQTRLNHADPTLAGTEYCVIRAIDPWTKSLAHTFLKFS